MFSVDSNFWAGRAVIRAQGELDYASAPQMLNELRAAERLNPSRIELDLTGLSFFDTAGVHLLEDAAASARTLGHDLVVRCGGTRVRRVLELCGISSAEFAPAEFALVA